MAQMPAGFVPDSFEPDQPSPTPAPTVFGMTMKPGPEADAIASAEVMGQPLVPPVGRLLQTIGGKAVAGAKYYSAAAKAATTQATPVLKYEAARLALEGMGVPGPVAAPIAMVVSGYKRGARAPAATPAPAPAAPAPRVPAQATGTAWGHVPPASVAPSAPRVSPAASTPAVPASPAATSAPVSGSAPAAAPRWSPQRIRNEVGLAEKRAGLKLTESQREQADRLVAQGQTPQDAVRAMAGPAPPAPTTTSAARALPPQPARLKLNAQESKEYVRLRQAGKTHNEAAEAIEAQRAFAQQFGTPSVADVRKAVAERNVTGRWKK